jgi:hypothetical protein
MNIENLPNPVADISIRVTSFEDLGNLKMINFLWFLCPQQRETAHGHLLFKAHFIKSKIEKNPIQKKEFDKEFSDWSNAYVHHDNVFLYYAEQAYGLQVKDFIKGFPKVIKALEKQESFIRNVTPQQQRFLNILIESSFCKAIAEGRKPTMWDYYKILFRFARDRDDTISKTVAKINFKLAKLSFQFMSNQTKALEKFQIFFSKLFGDYMYELNIHYFLNYFYENDDLKDLFDSSETEKNKLIEEPQQSKDSPNLTNSQLVLIYYYFFKQYGLEPRKDISVSPLARFIHLTTGKNFSEIQNSDVYKKLRDAPNFKTDEELVKDLNVIRPLFAKCGFNDILQSIDNEIDIAKNEMKL